MAAEAESLRIQPPARPRPARAFRSGLDRPDDRYVPVHTQHVVGAIRSQRGRFGAVAIHIDRVFDAFDGVIGQETMAFHRLLTREYDAFNPARETIDVPGDDEVAARRRRLDGVWSMVDYLLDKANYEQLDDAQVEAAIGRGNSHGIRIRVNPDRLQRIDLYVRGQSEQERVVRTVRHPIRGEHRRIELFRRLAVVYQMQDEEHVNLKLFRDIPIVDVEALLPHAEVAMSPMDRIKILGGGLGALGGLVTKAGTAVFDGTMAFTQLTWAGIAALLGLSVRSFFGYRRAKHVRTSQMTHNLYYQNVANNSGVLDLLLGNITQEELKEALVAYAVLHAEPAIADCDALEVAVQDWLRAAFEVDVDFDGPDALETLDRLALWADRERLRPCPPAEAITRLEHHWRERKSIDYHHTAWQARVKAA